MVTESQAAVAVAAPTTAVTCVCGLCSVIYSHHWILIVLYAAILLTCAAVLVRIILACRLERKKYEALEAKRNAKHKCTSGHCA